MKTEVDIHIIEIVRVFVEQIHWISDNYLMEIYTKIDEELQKRKQMDEREKE
jgi:hypothetical protein